MRSGRLKQDGRSRRKAGALLCLFLTYVFLSGLMPFSAAARANVPIPLQEICHTASGPVSGTPEHDDSGHSLPCCVFCCGTTHQEASAPPRAADSCIRRPGLVGRLGPWPQRLTLPDGDFLPPQARAPPVLI